jgi:hypothetical protein
MQEEEDDDDDDDDEDGDDTIAIVCKIKKSMENRMKTRAQVNDEI